MKIREYMRALFGPPIGEQLARQHDLEQARAATDEQIRRLRQQLATARAENARLRRPKHADLSLPVRRIDRALREVQAVVDDGPRRWRNSFPGRPGYDTDSIINAALHDGQNLAREVERLRGLLGEVLGHFTQTGHPGQPCVRTGWIRENTVAAWRRSIDGSRSVPDAAVPPAVARSGK